MCKGGLAEPGPWVHSAQNLFQPGPHGIGADAAPVERVPCCDGLGLRQAVCPQAEHAVAAIVCLQRQEGAHELQQALQNDQTGIAALTAAIDKRVRFDAAQTLTAPEQLQARTNIGAVASTDIGDTSTDFVAIFEAQLIA